MGQATSSSGSQSTNSTSPQVLLHIYDVGGHQAIQSVNKLFRALGTGAFHAGVEVYGQEWSYGFCPEGSGVFSTTPKFCPPHSYRETLDMGPTPLSAADVIPALERLHDEWQGQDYDLLRHNCCHFSEALCKALQVAPFPLWVTNLAGAGATVQNGAQQAYEASREALDRARSAAIIAKAKAGELDQQYQIRGTVTAKASELLVKAGELDAQYHITERASVAASTLVANVQAGAQAIQDRAAQLDREHNISGQAQEHATRIAAGVADGVTHLQQQAASAMAAQRPPGR